MVNVSVKIKKRSGEVALKEVLEEVQKLRREVSLFFPQEDIGGYANQKRIRESFLRAQHKYPVRSRQ
ncbi:MAG: hypothetical protein AAB417_00695 [Patescibacteria group bacterium]